MIDDDHLINFRDQDQGGASRQVGVKSAFLHASPPPLMGPPENLHCLSRVHGEAPPAHPSLTRRLRGT